MKRSNLKKNLLKEKFNKKLVFLISFCVLLAVILLWRFRDGSSDYRIGVITPDKIGLISVSPNRKMVNILKVSNEIELWKPGSGWIRVDNIDVSSDILMYNFGFIPDSVVFLDDIEEWKKNSTLVKNLGFVRWAKFIINKNQMLVKEEEIKNNIVDEYMLIDEIMPRDFADDNLVNEDLRISVFNNTEQEGVAGFIARRLEWMGFSVISTDNSVIEVDNCLIHYGPKTENSFGYKVLSKAYNCKNNYDDGLNENEIEIYFGETYVQMLKYSSYK